MLGGELRPGHHLAHRAHVRRAVQCGLLLHRRLLLFNKRAMHCWAMGRGGRDKRIMQRTLQRWILLRGARNVCHRCAVPRGNVWRNGGAVYCRLLGAVQRGLLRYQYREDGCHLRRACCLRLLFDRGRHRCHGVGPVCGG